MPTGNPEEAMPTEAEEKPPAPLDDKVLVFFRSDQHGDYYWVESPAAKTVPTMLGAGALVATKARPPSVDPKGRIPGVEVIPTEAIERVVITP